MLLNKIGLHILTTFNKVWNKPPYFRRTRVENVKFLEGRKGYIIQEKVSSKQICKNNPTLKF